LLSLRWKIYGENGASKLLGLKPTTLIEKMKRMKIKKPAKKVKRSSEDNLNQTTLH
jgi:hypothetical protein